MGSHTKDGYKIMKEELIVTFPIPDRFVKMTETGKYYIPEDFPYNKVVEYIKNFSIQYYGIDVDVYEKDLVPEQSKIDPTKWTITHSWLDEPDYPKMSCMLYELSNFGPKNDNLFAPPRKKSYYSLFDYKNLQTIYNSICYKKPSRKDVFKSMIKSFKSHIKMLK
jgi:hypothetical protein